MKQPSRNGCHTQSTLFAGIWLQRGEDILNPLGFKIEVGGIHNSIGQLVYQLIAGRAGLHLTAQERLGINRKTIHPVTAIVNQRLASRQESTEVCLVNGRLVDEEGNIKPPAGRIGIAIDQLQHKFLGRAQITQGHQVLFPVPLLGRHIDTIDPQADHLDPPGQLHSQSLLGTA